MDVLICEDNIEQLYRLKKIIEDFGKTDNLNINVLIASTKSEDIIRMIDNKQYTVGALFILDIYLDKSNINGFELAQRIRKQDWVSSIVFSTTHSEMTYMTFLYKVEALDYVLKDETDTYQERIIECVKIAYLKKSLANERAVTKEPFFYFKVGPKRIRIYENDFVYAETSENKHRVIIHTVNQQLEVYSTLNELKLKSSKIIRCHNSYVVNRDKIKLLDLNEMKVLLNDGQFCYISRKYVAKLKTILEENDESVLHRNF
ncbi:LytR/AlgR family response regulator transcription factor [Dellaglioa sp. L3N]